MEYGGSTPFLTTSVQEPPGSSPTPEVALPDAGLDHRDLNSGTQNGVEPPYSLILTFCSCPTP
jgi:hypothetical protein